MKMDEKKNRAELFKLMQENSELPVVPMVDGEVVAGDEYGYWMASWGKATIDEWLTARDGKMLFKSGDDVFDTLEKYLSYKEFDALPEDEDACRAAYGALPWKKAIIVYIELPNGG